MDIEAANDGVAERRHYLRDASRPALGAILVKGDIPDPMHLVLDEPGAVAIGKFGFSRFSISAT